MDPTEKIFLLHKLLIQSRSPVHIDRICQELRCSTKTFYRIRRKLESVTRHEIENCNEQYYRYVIEDGETIHFPGLWFTNDEIDALICFNNMLNTIQAGILECIMQPFKKKLFSLFDAHEITEQVWNSRIKIIPIAQRSIDQEIFRIITDTVLHGKRCRIAYKSLSSEIPEVREISPQTLLRYRDNWYVDAHCHSRGDLRTFALSRIESTEKLQSDAVTIDRSVLEQHYTSTYGIFNGSHQEIATINFTGIAAREIAHEEWHPAQKTAWINDTTLQLTIPYCDATELIMDILRWGDMAEVISPESLRTRLRQIFENGVRLYA
jgi:predicted DNA-binding transcriptional regulator YafY